MESFGIKEHFIAWKQLRDQILNEIMNEDEGEESINELKVILDKIASVTKEVLLSLVFALHKSSGYNYNN